MLGESSRRSKEGERSTGHSPLHAHDRRNQAVPVHPLARCFIWTSHVCPAAAACNNVNAAAAGLLHPQDSKGLIAPSAL
ncbi:hypothetical protein CBOM_08044 [Ceraceosorus bombacis]|uniref:Uncharacterized protein n=1 Tax=Ceraceosorus bombacis TaxID=401625 RepID=A0A0P1BK72_9BASI|nr:hypothetical protein CBOM_08044 [Ceraceosorus bombacis]